jgi:hypothetical protein
MFRGAAKANLNQIAGSDTRGMDDLHKPGDHV